MEVFDCIRNRRTVREFRPEPIPEEVIHKLLQAGRWAPSSSNSQPWHFVVVQDPTTLKKLGEIATQGPFVANAPVVIAIAMENAPRPQLDAGRAIQQMELAAWSEGLGTCFVGVRQEEQQRQVKELLGIPAELELITVMPYGYRVTGTGRNGTPRKALSEMAHREMFGQAFPGYES